MVSAVIDEELRALNEYSLNKLSSLNEVLEHLLAINNVS